MSESALPPGWKQSQHCIERFVGFMRLSVIWATVKRGEPGGFAAHVDRFTLNDLYKSQGEAAKAAERKARELLTRALTALNETDTDDETD